MSLKKFGLISRPVRISFSCAMTVAKLVEPGTKRVRVFSNILVGPDLQWIDPEGGISLCLEQSREAPCSAC
jgi:hypothetical protein